MKLPRGVWIVLGLILVAAVVCSYLSYQSLFRPVNMTQSADVSIRPGASFNYVARRLEQRRIIPSALAFTVYARATGQAGLLKVGEYEVRNGQRPVDVLEMLVEGRAKAFWLTVPEGKWTSEIASLLDANWPGATEQFVTLTRQPGHWQDVVAYPLPSTSLEGYLFPDTYCFAKGADAEQITRAMLKRFQATCWNAYRTHPPADGRSLHNVLTLASLVEGEAKLDRERPVIAGVYMNRLRQGMRLQCDATVLYAHQRRLSRVLYRDLEYDSRYNTYRYAGLPPGPINNPGLASFQAALQPAQVPYLYYVARPDGSHIFSRTLSEHRAAISRIRGK